LANFNAIPPYISADAKDLQEAIGVSQLSVGANEDSWHQTIGGLLIQGGKIIDVPANNSVVVNFHAAYPKKVLGIWIQLIAAALAGAPPGRHFINPLSLSQFQVFNDYVDDSTYYWWAIGY